MRELANDWTFCIALAPPVTLQQSNETTLLRITFPSLNHRSQGFFHYTDLTSHVQVQLHSYSGSKSSEVDAAYRKIWNASSEVVLGRWYFVRSGVCLTSTPVHILDQRYLPKHWRSRATSVAFGGGPHSMWPVLRSVPDVDVRVTARLIS